MVVHGGVVKVVVIATARALLYDVVHGCVGGCGVVPVLLVVVKAVVVAVAFDTLVREVV